jgi:hypothetical protein
MKDFSLWSPAGSIVAIDTSNLKPLSQAYSSVEFESWEEAEAYFLKLGSPQENVNSARDALREKGMAKLMF